MSFEDLMKDLVTVLRLVEGENDAYGKLGLYEPVKDAHGAAKTARGRLEATTGQLKVLPGQGESAIGTYRLYLLLTYQDGSPVDVTEADRVLIDGQVYLIDFVDPMDAATRAHHVELLLRVAK